MKFYAPIALAVFCLFACEKVPAPPSPGPAAFALSVQNDFNELQARYAVFLSDEDGTTVAFRWLPGRDTARIEVPNSTSADRFDCTVLKITTLDAPGSGVRDTALVLNTYTNIASGQSIYLRDLEYRQVTDLKFNLTGLTSLDSIIVPNSNTFSRPQASNSYYGQYRIIHTGKIWLRILINGEKFWRFIRFDDVATGTLDAHTIDASLMLQILATPRPLALPFTTTWEYELDGIVDTAAQQFFPLGAPLRPLGSPIPVFNGLEVFEPINNELFEPNIPYAGFRLRTYGPDASANGYTYYSDGFYDSFPNTLPTPTFDLSPTILSDNRLVAVQCSGAFDLLAFSRSRAGTPNIQWEVFTKPSATVTYRLPDVPKAVGDLYPALKNYDFGGTVRARAEAYERLDSYDAVIRQRLLHHDPFWQARAGYLAREEVQ
jgi:hypothetical protein